MAEESAKPFVSVVVAAYNARDTLARCLEALLGQEYPAFEVIVVDNASTDDTREIASRYCGRANRESRESCGSGSRHLDASDSPDSRFPAASRRVTLLDEPRRGWPAARNRAWHWCKAPLVANIDADCFAEPTWLRELVAALEREAGAGCAVGRTFVEPGATLAQQFYAANDPFNIEKYVQRTERAFGRACPWGGGNNCFRREVIEAVGGYDAETYTSGADREYHKRFEEATGLRTVYVPEAVIWHVARGSAGEFFRNAAKYACDAVVHAQFDPGVAAHLRGYVRRNLGFIGRNAAGLVWRAAKFLVGRETRLRVSQPFFYSVQELGSIWGHLKGRRRVAARKRHKR
ncbi:MAG TPA: glycosyltransferase [Planctomycetota bacterium]|nr:glycosyltransferase [Planctomycetota bacterium]HRR78867.1 glycosyltransferase [Planctomycetota bacterium]HRT92827.1 glycosyltransferase [Planctomycetota bacterium]